jgi:hypothetical protein
MSVNMALNAECSIHTFFSRKNFDLWYFCTSHTLKKVWLFLLLQMDELAFYGFIDKKLFCGFKKYIFSVDDEKKLIGLKKCQLTVRKLR